jgi:hypothetical protein
MTSIREVGPVFCVAIQREICVTTCPLTKGACLWQHRKTQHCKYTPEELTADEFCARVGLTPPDKEQQAEIFEKLKFKLSP